MTRVSLPNECIQNLVELRTDGPGTGYSVGDVEVIPSNAPDQKVCLLSIGGLLPRQSAGLAAQLAVPAIRVSHNSPAWFRDVVMRIAGATKVLEKRRNPGVVIASAARCNETSCIPRVSRLSGAWRLGRLLAAASNSAKERSNEPYRV